MIAVAYDLMARHGDVGVVAVDRKRVGLSYGAIHVVGDDVAVVVVLVVAHRGLWMMAVEGLDSGVACRPYVDVYWSDTV